MKQDAMTAKRNIGGVSLFTSVFAILATTVTVAAQESVAVMFTPGINGAAVESLLPKFEQETGIEVVPVVMGTADIGPKLKLAAENGRAGWDAFLSIPTDQFLSVADQAVYAELSLDGLQAEVVSEFAAKKLMGENWLSGAAGAIFLVYPAGLKEPPTSWEDFFDLEKYPGNRGMGSGGQSVYNTLEIALKGDGVSPSDLYPIDADRAFDKLSSIRDNIVLWDAAPQGIEGLVNGNLAMAWSYAGAAVLAVENGLPVKIAVVPGTGFGEARSGVMQHGPNGPDAGQAFIDWWYQPDVQAEYTKATGGGFAIPAEVMLDALDDETKAYLPYVDEAGGTYYPINYEYYFSENASGMTVSAELLERWSEWRIGG